VAVLCNEAGAHAEELSERVAALFIPQLSAPSPAAPAPVAPLPPSSGPLGVELGALSGTYFDDGTNEVRIVDTKDGAIHLRFGKLPARLLRKAADGPPGTFARIAPIGSVPAAKLAEYAGRYGSDELPRDIVLAVKDGKLRIGPFGAGLSDEPFVPLAADVFVLGGVDGRFERDARGKVRGLVLSSERTRHVRLERR
jgi:hypothetical protein